MSVIQTQTKYLNEEGELQNISYTAKILCGGRWTLSFIKIAIYLFSYVKEGECIVFISPLYHILCFCHSRSGLFIAILQ